jgi:hypothetical protein
VVELLETPIAIPSGHLGLPVEAVKGRIQFEMVGFAYGGPDDGLTRPFCEACLGFWFSPELVRGLDNGQTGLPHPLESGGGYNCRHSWLAVPLATAKRWGYKEADASTVRTANNAATG